ncbi:MAG: sulfotransferase family protein [Rhodanobacteraceae bacterium]
MPLKIIGAGYGRTGTMSICTALNQLGFPCYHMFEVLENKDNKSHLDFWRKVANAPADKQQDWETVFAKYTAAVDNPACSVWRELIAAYPEAKVLLSLHPGGAEAWYESTLATIYFTESLWQFKVLEVATPFARKLGDMCHKLIWQRAHRGSMNDRAKAIAEYHQHVADVQAAVPPDRLLVFTVNEGWKPLCDFIGAPVPDAPFPRVNDREQFKQVKKELTRGAYVILGLAAAVIAGATYGAINLW